ncbi:MAG: hypothetical protein AB1638_06055 [Nitrospirota bacterium]
MALSKKFIALLFITLIPITIYFLLPSDVSRIKKLFKEGSMAVEKEDLDGLMSKVSFNYRDDHGLTYLYIKTSMKSIFQQLGDIKIEYENLVIKLNDKIATADVSVRVIATAGTDTGYILGNTAKPVHLRFTLEKERTKWRVTRTEGLSFDF